MSDWLDRLGALEREASGPGWRKEIGDRPDWQEDKGFLVTKCAPSESVVCRLDWPSDMSSDTRDADAKLIVALRNSARELVESACRAEELDAALRDMRSERGYHLEQARQWEGNAIDAEERIEHLEREVERLGAELNTKIEFASGCLHEMRDVHDILAEALGYPLGEHGYDTGDHTVVTLAMETRRRL